MTSASGEIPLLGDVARELVARSRADQGLPATVSDRAALGAIALVLVDDRHSEAAP